MRFSLYIIWPSILILNNLKLHQQKKANQWYNDNGVIVNKTKHQALILGDTEYTFSFPVKESIDIFGMNIDNKLHFDKHVSSVCKKINNQLNVMIRFRKLLSKATLVKLYKAFILPHFHYCSSVWHFCGARNTEKLDALNKRSLIPRSHQSLNMFKSCLVKHG